MKYKRFYWSPSKEYYEDITADMSDNMKKGFANALAHGMMPLYRTDKGVWMTRSDYLMNYSDYYKYGKPTTSLVDNDGKWHYYKEFEQ